MTESSAGARPRPSPYPRPDAPAPVAAEPSSLVAAETEVADKAAKAKRQEAADKAKAGRQKGTRSPDQIRADIAATREELAQTVDSLAAKLDVKTRARAGADQARAYATDPENRPQVIAAVVALLALVALRVTRSRRKS